MRCHGCGSDAPTRFLLLGRSVGYIVAFQTDEVALDLCESCLDRVWGEFDDVNSTRGLLGRGSFAHAVWYMVRNRLELRRARRQPPDPAQAEPAAAQAITIRKCRVILGVRALNLAAPGISLLALSALFAGGGALLGLHRNSGFAIVASVVLAAAVAGILLIVAAVRRRDRMMTMPEEEFLDLLERNRRDDDRARPRRPRRTARPANARSPGPPQGDGARRSVRRP